MEVTLIFALAVCLAASAVAVCPSGWSQHGKSCYFLSIDARNWNNSMNACQVLGGYLAEIETKEENDFITAECFKRVRRDYWVGGMDINEGNWIWMHSGNPFNFTHWYPGEPNDMKINSNLTEDCLGLPNGFSYAWNDGFCHARAYYICEKDLKEISSGPAVPIIG